MRNTGEGCAANVRGTSTIYRDREGQQQVGAADWAYGTVVHPGAQVGYAGDAINVPTSGQWFWRSSVSWDNVRC
jgi:hypothetical protein